MVLENGFALTCRFSTGFGSSIIGTNCTGNSVVVISVVVVVASVVVVVQGVVVTNGSSSTKLFSSSEWKTPLVLGLHKPGSLVIQQYLYHFTALYNFWIFWICYVNQDLRFCITDQKPVVGTAGKTNVKIKTKIRDELFMLTFGAELWSVIQ